MPTGPHACGEDVEGRSEPWSNEDSPPRVWGRLAAGEELDTGFGLTPTRVRKSPGLVGSWREGRVNPRVSGEDRHADRRSGAIAGRPTCVWKTRIAVSRSGSRRTDPHGCGEDATYRVSVEQARDRPHTCGEDIRADTVHTSRVDRPPRVWGRRHRPRPADRRAGQTPTHVGKAPWDGSGGRISRTDPHVCGEDGTGETALAEAADRPPHMWGGCLIGALLAGYTERLPRVWGRCSVTWGVEHQQAVDWPHACGEDGVEGISDDGFEDRPPRVWGRRLTQGRVLHAGRQTPTRVGNLCGLRQVLAWRGATPTSVGRTDGSSGRRSRRPEDPHARGEARR